MKEIVFNILNFVFKKLKSNKITPDIIHIRLKYGTVVIETRPDLAPNHVNQIKTLILDKKYDGVVFHRVIDGFMAQTGDVEFGNSNNDSFDLYKVGMGGSELPDIDAEFSDVNHIRSTVSMARSRNLNSANSQFFICLDDALFLDNKYTIWGRVIKGMEFVDNIRKGGSNNGAVTDDPDKIITMEVINK